MDAETEDRIADRVAATALRDRDAAWAELAKLRSRLESRLEAAEADAQHWQGKAGTMAHTIRTIVNSPKMSREQVQSRLLVALQRYDG